jgi:chemotaxis-related protein WspD
MPSLEHQPPATQLPALSGNRPEPEDCWNRIGDGGCGTCPELSKFVRCRNCPVYARAGAQLLDRALTPAERQAWSVQFAQARTPAAPAKISAVFFRIESNWLALPTLVFQEIAERRLIHSLPHRRRGIILGLANIRGELLLCVSLGHLLGWRPPAPPEKLRASARRLLVVRWEADRFVFPVDEVHGIHRFTREELKEPAAGAAKMNPAYTEGLLMWRQQTAGFMEPERLFAGLNRNLA